MGTWMAPARDAEGVVCAPGQSVWLSQRLPQPPPLPGLVISPSSATKLLLKVAC